VRAIGKAKLKFPDFNLFIIEYDLLLNSVLLAFLAKFN
jgi:hypothetical protein